MKMANFNLPNEIWCMIFSYLPLEPKKNATATCKLWFRLIREDPKLSEYILISWYNMEKAIDKLQWNWNNWPALKTLELKSHPLAIIEDSRETIEYAIEKISLKDCPPSLEEVLFEVDLTLMKSEKTRVGWILTLEKTHGWSLLKYQRSTDQVFGLGQKLDSMQKWKEYESNMRALKILNCMKYMASGTRPQDFSELISAKMVEISTSNDLFLLIASKEFLTLRRVCDYVLVYNQDPGHRPLEIS